MATAVLGGIATFIGTNIVLSLAYGFACGTSQFLNMLLRFSVFALPIKVAGWAIATWVGMGAFAALGGF